MKAFDKCRANAVAQIMSITAFVFFTLFSQPAVGNPVDENLARTVARGFWNESTMCGEVKTLVDVSGRIGLHDIFVFEINDGEGFVMVAGDDNVWPVLGYGYGSVPAAALRPNVQKWLKWYETQIQSVKGLDRTADSKTAAEWQRLSGNTAKRPSRKSVGQLLTTQWDQYPLYNNMCPYDAEAGDHAVTGCSATATAQVMKYWNHPPVGQGSHSYNEDDFGRLTVDFGSTHYRWDIMPDRLSYGSTEDEINAVAELMYHVGVAIEMDYSVEGSGAYTISYGGWFEACSENALVNYFDYKPTIQGLERDYYSDNEWLEIIKNEIDNRRPIVYTGNDSTGGHAFVCDGYDDQLYFHMNWGWGGALDGYFRLDSLVLDWGGAGTNESFTFNYDQTALIGIEPNEDALRVTPEVFNNVATLGAELTATVRTSSNTADWHWECDAPWIEATPLSGRGGQEIAQISIVVSENTGDEDRTAIATITQGGESKQITIVQHGTSDLQSGWVGNHESTTYTNMNGGEMAIICPERYGTYRPTDFVTKVRFVTCRSDDYPQSDNDTFLVRIYRNPTSVDAIPGMLTWLAAYTPDNYLGELAYEQVYVQTEPGVQVVTLDTPYQIGTDRFWIAVYCYGETLLMYDYTDECPEPIAIEDYPNAPCAAANYRYLQTMYDYDLLYIAYTAFCSNDPCDSVVQGNVDFALDFYVQNITTDVPVVEPFGQLKVYPNPAHESLYVEGENVSRVEMIDQSGRMVAEWNRAGRLDISPLGKGIYFLRITSPVTSEVRRVVLQ